MDIYNLKEKLSEAAPRLAGGTGGDTCKSKRNGIQSPFVMNFVQGGQSSSCNLYIYFTHGNWREW